MLGRDLPTTGVEEKEKEFLCPLSWSIHHNMARDGYIESTCCCVQVRFLVMETKILFPLYIHHNLIMYLKLWTYF